MTRGTVLCVMALLAIIGINGKKISEIIDITPFISKYIPSSVFSVAGLVFFGVIIVTFLSFTLWKKRKENNEK